MKKSVWQENYKIFYSELRAVRKAAGYTQAELAQKLNKPQSYVSKYESGDRNLDFIEVLQVCKACNTDPNILIQKVLPTLDN